MTKTFQQKVDAIKKSFSFFSTQEERYSALIEMGKKMSSFPEHLKTKETEVRGCQSNLYLHAECNDGKIFFTATSDALISAGLAAILIAAYNEEPPEVVLKSPPHFIHEIGIYASLSPNRSNGLNHIYLRMKQEALKCLMMR